MSDIENKIDSINDEGEYDPYILSLTDEDGTEYIFEVLDEIEYNDERYLALMPKYDDPKEALEYDGELVILKSVMTDDEEMFDEISDDAEYEDVASIFSDRLQDLFEISDTEE